MHLSPTEMVHTAQVQVVGQDEAPLCSLFSSVIFLTSACAGSGTSDLVLEKSSPFLVSPSVLLTSFHLQMYCILSAPSSAAGTQILVNQTHEDIHLLFPSIPIRMPLMITAVLCIFFTIVFTQKETNSSDSTDNRRIFLIF